MREQSDHLADALGLLAKADLSTARQLRSALSTAIHRAICLLDAVDAATEDLEDGADAEALNEDGDVLDLGEVDGWRRPRRARLCRTTQPHVAARDETRRLQAIVSPNVRLCSRGTGGRHA